MIQNVIDAIIILHVRLEPARVARTIRLLDPLYPPIDHLLRAKALQRKIYPLLRTRQSVQR
jgi:hypothetical protein